MNGVAYAYDFTGAAEAWSIHAHSELVPHLVELARRYRFGAWPLGGTHP